MICDFILHKSTPDVRVGPVEFEAPCSCLVSGRNRMNLVYTPTKTLPFERHSAEVQSSLPRGNFIAQQLNRSSPFVSIPHISSHYLLFSLNFDAISMLRKWFGVFWPPAALRNEERLGSEGSQSSNMLVTDTTLQVAALISTKACQCLIKSAYRSSNTRWSLIESRLYVHEPFQRENASLCCRIIFRSSSIKTRISQLGYVWCGVTSKAARKEWLPWI